jgi:hypothetical protein
MPVICLFFSPSSALVTKCNYQDTYTTCQQLANLGYLPKGVQSFEAKSLTGEAGKQGAGRGGGKSRWRGAHGLQHS